MTHPTDALRLVQDEYVLVPREPTGAMLKAAFSAMNATPSGTWKRMKAEARHPIQIFNAKMRPRWSAMLAAAPASPLPEGGVRLSKNLGQLKSPDQDALEKRLRDAADDFADHATPIEGDGPTATLLREAADMIAELKEARGLLQGFVDDENDAVTNPLGGLSLGGLMDGRDNSGCVYQSAALEDRIIQTRAFLARNGKGEG